MPEYCFKDRESGEPVDLVLGMSEMWSVRRDDDSIVWQGRVLDRDYSRELGDARKAAWPLLSDAAGVHPDQIPMASENMRRAGVSLNYTADGRAIFESAAHRRAALKVMKLRDKNGFD